MTPIYAKLIGSVILWGGTWVAGRVLGRSMGPFSSAFLRFALASVFLVFLTARIEGRIPKLTRGNLPWLLTLAATGILSYNVFFFAGLQRIPAGRASLISASIPAVVALFSGLFFKEAFTLSKVAGIVVAFTGVSVIVSGGNPLALAARPPSTGDLCIFGCVLTWAAYTLAGKKAMEQVPPFASVTWSCLLGAAMLLPLALAHGLIRDMARPVQAPGVAVVFRFLATGFGFSWYYEGVQASARPGPAFSSIWSRSWRSCSAGCCSANPCPHL
jgi:drug/metabolite transporter (DMT)-like permease